MTTLLEELESMNVFPPTYSELVSDALSFGLTGRQVDTLISGIFNSALKSDDPISILNIPLRNLSEFEKFVDSDKVDVILFDRVVRLYAYSRQNQNIFQ